MRPKVATVGNESADPYDRFYAIKDKQSLQVRKARCSKELGWDPWPVTKVQKDTSFDTATKLVQQRNAQCVNICVNKIKLLPANGNIPGVQGGSRGLPLYSLRSPDTLPMKFHLWHVAGLETGEKDRTIAARRSQVRQLLQSALSCDRSTELLSMHRAHFLQCISFASPFVLRECHC